jgi:hypothetical protein
VVKPRALTPDLALRTQYLVLSTAVMVGINGCSPANLGPELREPSLEEQLRGVQASSTEEIHVSATPIDDNDLAPVAAATALRVLILDHPESRVSVVGIRYLAGLPKLEHLRLRGLGIDDQAVAEIAKIKSLQILNVPRGEFTDAGLAQLKELPMLLQLRFGSPRVTDAGVAGLAEFPALLRLHLIDVPIGDEGLRALAKMEQLESLYIDGGNISDEAVEELFRARPKLHVHLNQEHHDRDPHRHAHP